MYPLPPHPFPCSRSTPTEVSEGYPGTRRRLAIDANEPQAPPTTFEHVATVIGIYKVSKYWANLAETEPDTFTPGEREAKQRELIDAEAMLQDLVDEFADLTAASRQQLFIFFNELHQDGTTDSG